MDSTMLDLPLTHAGRLQLAATLMASGVRHKDIAARLGVDRTTINLWLNRADFQAMLMNEQMRVIDEVRAQVRAVASKAIETLVEIMEDASVPPGARVRAAATLLGKVADGDPRTVGSYSASWRAPIDAVSVADEAIIGRGAARLNG